MVVEAQEAAAAHAPLLRLSSASPRLVLVASDVFRRRSRDAPHAHLRLSSILRLGAIEVRTERGRLTVLVGCWMRSGLLLRARHLQPRIVVMEAVAL